MKLLQYLIFSILLLIVYSNVHLLILSIIVSWEQEDQEYKIEMEAFFFCQ